MNKTLKTILAKEVLLNKHLLFGKLTPSITRKRRNELWETIRQKLLDNGAEEMTVQHLRDQVWGNLKRATTAKYQRSCQSGAAGVEFEEYENLVLDAIGRESLEPLSLPDVPPSFAQPKLHTVTLNLDTIPIIFQDDASSTEGYIYYFLNVVAVRSKISFVVENVSC